MELRILVVVLLAATACCVAGAAAHVPVLAPGGTSVQGAAVVPDNAKSYAWYGTAGSPGGMEYYRLEFARGDSMVFSLSTPDPGFLPMLSLLVPGNRTGEVVPPGIDLPPGYEVLGVPGALPLRATYEPFTPMAMYEISSLEGPAPVDGVYYAVISAPSAGRTILATGYLEEFSPAEWLGIPVEVARIRLWQGQSPFLLVIPYGIGFLVMGFLLWRNKKESRNTPGIYGWSGMGAGALYVGSGLLVLAEMGIALSVTGWDSGAGLTLIFAGIPLALGAGAFVFSLRADGAPGFAQRIGMLVIAGLGLVFWAGILVGPALAVLAAIAPPYGTA
ncbi:hypothetical protein J2741_000767 [Methanolinea mesophila]|uniref:hypothetical protein n=1 Tax=Methanolinea mesophila TaxID=547055 RepID=UPI001AE7EB1E|nr:hypothetical protein [Methanolinea mesophila]MBP1928220.1 hypothetical protein [Methanolinea mesophila]